MKKLLEKPWAKALAFLLTLLPGTAAVYGGVELVYIYVYNMHTDRRLDMLWAVTAVCAVVAAASLVFSLSAAGHWPGHEGVHLTWVEKIPVDLFVLGLTCMWYICLDAMNYPSATLGLAVFVALAYLFVLAFTARCKAGTVLSDLLALRLLRLFSRGAVWTWRHLRRLFLGLPLAWKTAVVLLAVMAADLLIFAYGMDGGQAALYVTLHLVLLGAAIWQVLALRQLQRGGESLAKGDFSHPITLSRGALPELKRHAANLNSVQQGIQQAVEEKMKSERLKTQLITNVSHDIKTPLTSIINYVDLLQKVDVQPETAREYIAVLDRQSRRLKKLTEDLVEASKASSGALPVELQPTDVAVLFDQIVGEYQERLADCRLTLVARPPETPVSVRADGKLLSRVMDNLVSNICKYALEDTRVYVVAARDDETVTISFKNVSRAELNISPDELMERFVRGDASRHTEGSGLGLSIAGSLVRLMNGTFALSIDGDLFRADVTLPRA